MRLSNESIRISILVINVLLDDVVKSKHVLVVRLLAGIAVPVSDVLGNG